MPIAEAIHELTHHGSRPRSHEQIVAIAASNHDRRPKRAMGGGIAMGGLGNGIGGLNPNTIDHMTPMGGIAGPSGPPTINPAPPPPPGSGVPSNNPSTLTPFGPSNFGPSNRFDLGRNGMGDGFRGADPMMMMNRPQFGSLNPSTIDTGGPMARPFRHGGIAHLAGGGVFGSGNDTGFERMEARDIGSESQYHPGGFISSDVAGRTDRLPLSVAADSFVMPADVVSGLGQGNSLAGAKMLDAITSSPAPYGVRPSGGHRGSGPPRPPRSTGGTAGKSSVILAGGEYSVPPEKLAAIGARRRKAGMSKARTDLAAGHEWAREFVDRIRKHQKKFLATAPKPKR